MLYFIKKQPDVKNFGKEKLGELIRSDDTLRGHVSLLEGNSTLQKKCNEKIITNFDEILQKTDIQQYLIDLFRKSKSFDELGKKLSGNSGSHIGLKKLREKMNMMCKDMIKDTVTPYIKKGGR